MLRPPRRCLLAAVAQFWPQKFPANWWVLFVCVSLYAIASVCLSLFTSRAEGEVFLFLEPEVCGRQAAAILTNLAKCFASSSMIYPKLRDRHCQTATCKAAGGNMVHVPVCESR